MARQSLPQAFGRAAESATPKQIADFNQKLKVPQPHGVDAGRFGQPSGLSRAVNNAAWSKRARIHAAMAERGNAQAGREDATDKHYLPNDGETGE
jgi:hypothetical protein